MRRGAPDRSLADLACGTGTFLLGWAARHPDWSLVGTDQSAGMLAAARRNLRAAGVRARLVRGRLQERSFTRAVGAAVCVFDSLNHLTRRADLRRTFESVGRSLLPGGLFLFDLNEERAFARLFTGTWSVESAGLHVSATASASRDGTYGSIRFTIFLRAGRNWQRSELTIRERNWKTEEVRADLETAGLTLLRVRRIEPYPTDQVEAPRSFWVCRSRRPVP